MVNCFFCVILTLFFLIALTYWGICRTFTGKKTEKNHFKKVSC